MLRRLRASVPGRLGAAAVALVLSGAPALAAAAAPEREHRCACWHARGEECSCARCHAAARRTSRPPVARAPPCHGPRSEEAPAPPCHGPRAAAPARPERREVPAAPAIAGCCGAPEPPGVALAGIERFTLPAADEPPAPPPPAPEVPQAGAGPREAPAAPEPPPPRPA